MSRRQASSAHGVLIVDKPSGPTSFDVVADSRRLFHTRQVGHAGTLDPLASGVLVVLLGEATKLSAYLTLARKAYRARLVFGRDTTTLDAEGATTREAALNPGWLTQTALDAAIQGERERLEQLPPQFSAIKVAGRTAHSLARKGVEVALAARPVEVLALEVVSASACDLELNLVVSKGYYVRALARDLCARLGVPGHLASLRRTQSGCFTLDEAVSWPARTDAPLLSVAEAARRALPSCELTALGVLLARQGKPIEVQECATPIPPGDGPIACLGPEGELVALTTPLPHRPGLKVLRGFNAAPRPERDETPRNGSTAPDSDNGG